MEALIVDNGDLEVNSDGAIQMLPRWIKYIGYKYPNLLHLDLSSPYDTRDASDSMVARFSQGMDTALANMATLLKKLKTYMVPSFLITEKIVTAMTCSNMHFEKLELWTIDYSNSSSSSTNHHQQQDFVFSTDFHSLLSSKPVNPIKSLSMSVHSGLDFETFSKALGPSAGNLIHLVKIDITSFEGISIPSLFAALQHLKSLESLTYRGIKRLQVQEEEVEWQILPTKGCTIKKLSFRLHAEAETLVLFSDILKFALKSCPLLEIFQLSGDVDYCKPPGSKLDLCFNDNPLLKQISVSMNNEFYTFSDLLERQKKYYMDDKNLMQKDLTRGSNYSVNLTWRGDVTLKLASTQS